MRLCSGGNGTATCSPKPFKFQKCYDLAWEWTQARTLTPHQTWYDCYAYTTPCSDVTPAAEARCRPAKDCSLQIDNTKIAKAFFFPDTDYRSWDLQLYHLQGTTKSFACFLDYLRGSLEPWAKMKVPYPVIWTSGVYGRAKS
ncbi:hypothetical protein PG993_010748 [Apiospora rasikravindrae]|uniref:Uncharacterized protein n=1 Tax=Apiospora rasikravindrae TaxID=990691 RepID=A0ABR1SEJ2_9PEZI